MPPHTGALAHPPPRMGVPEELMPLLRALSWGPMVRIATAHGLTPRIRLPQDIASCIVLHTQCPSRGLPVCFAEGKDVVCVLGCTL